MTDDPRDYQLHKPGYSRQHEVSYSSVQYCIREEFILGFADHYLRSGLGGTPAQGGVPTVITGRAILGAIDGVCITRDGTQCI